MKSWILILFYCFTIILLRVPYCPVIYQEYFLKKVILLQSVILQELVPSRVAVKDVQFEPGTVHLCKPGHDYSDPSPELVKHSKRQSRVFVHFTDGTVSILDISLGTTISNLSTARLRHIQVSHCTWLAFRIFSGLFWNESSTVSEPLFTA